MPIKDLFESSEHSTINIIVDTMSAQNKKVFIYISVNKDFMKNRCGPTWVRSLRSWTRECPLVKMPSPWLTAGCFLFCFYDIPVVRLDSKQKTHTPFGVWALRFKWSHLGSNQGPPDYESGALTN